MKLISKGPSSEGPKPVRRSRGWQVVAGIFAAMVGLGAASTASAQYTVEAGKSVRWTIPGVSGKSQWDGPFDDSWGGGQKPTKGSISYAIIDSYGDSSATYTARADASGVDSVRWYYRCDYQSTGNPYACGGGSASITIIPPKPSISGGSLTVPFNGSANHLTRPTTSGVTLSLVDAPSHGTVTFDFTMAMYRADAGYSGPDSFSIKGTNAGGDSDTVAVTVTVQAPPPPSIVGGSLLLPFNTSAVHDFAPTNGGVVSIYSAASHGTVTLNGGRATYVPDQDYIGTDSFIGRAANAGGQSLPQMVTVTVAPPPIPVLTGGNLSLGFNASGTHDFAPTSGGTLALASAASNGTVTISGGRATYVPDTNFIGTDSFGVIGENLGGKSAVTTISVTVAPPPIPVLTGGSLSLAFNTPGSHDFAPTSGGTIVLANAAAHGTVTLSGGRATYVPDPDYIGADSFGVFGENLGGRSGVTTIPVTVAPPPIPVLTGGSIAVAWNGTGSHDFQPSHGGTVALARPASHGTVTISGGRATYVPAADYIGPDSFTATGTNPGGTSGEFEVLVSVSAPDAPSAGSVSLSTPFNTAGSVVLPAGGVFHQLAIIHQPEHGLVVVSGTSAVYTPALGYFGDDGFTYEAVGLGGRSGPASVSVRVARPDAPTIGAVAASTGYGEAVTVELEVGGIFDAIHLSPSPKNGAATVAGKTLTYKPNGGFSGTEKFGVVASGPGGDSAIAEIAITVAEAPAEPKPPAPPVVSPGRLTVEGQSGAVMRFRVTQGLQGGPYKAVEIVDTPPVGTAAVENLDVLFTPPADFAGTVDFSYRVISDAAGPSAPAGLTAVVHAPAPEVVQQEVEASMDAPANVDLTQGATGGPFSNAAIVSMSPAHAGTAELVRGGQAGARAPIARAAKAFAAAPMEAAETFRLLFKPAENYFGEVIVRYSLTNRFDAPTMGVVRILVDTRVDPTRDAKVGAVVNAQAQAANRFGTTQIANVSRRLEARRDGVVSTGGIGLASARPTPTQEPFSDPRERMLHDLRASIAPAHQVQPSGRDEEASPSRLMLWSGGTIELGERKTSASGSGFDFATSGVSVGADMGVTDKVIAGVGLGAGRDKSDLGDGAKVIAQAASVFAYASYGASGAWFVDGLVGFGVLDFDTTRIANGSTIAASRSGDQSYAAVSAGWEFARGQVHVSPYGRLEVTRSRLKAYSEQGPDADVLTFERLNVEQQSGALGLRGHYAFKTDLGVFEPSMRAEYVWSLRSSGVASVGYAIGSDKRYQLPLSLGDERRGLAGGGLQWTTEGGWIFNLDLERLFAEGGSSTAVRIGASGSF